MTLEQAAKMLRDAGWRVNPPKAAAPVIRDAPPSYRMPRDADHSLIHVVFADDEKVPVYVLREPKGKKPWCVGPALRAACNKYRFRKAGYHAYKPNNRIPKDIWGRKTEVQIPATPLLRVKSIPVPSIARIEGLDIPLDAANAMTLEHREAA